MSVFDIYGNMIRKIYNINGNVSKYAYDKNGIEIYNQDKNLPVPKGELYANNIIMLPDLYEEGKGFTCTGLCYTENDDGFLIGDIGSLQPDTSKIKSQIVCLTTDLKNVKFIIPLYDMFSNMEDIQGIAYDCNSSTIWFCSPKENLIRGITKEGNNIGSFYVQNPTGIAYSTSDDSFWILTYANKIQHYNKQGDLLKSYDFNYNETLDQCFLDEEKGYLYITAGENYNNRNNIYLFNINTCEQSITCTVDSYSVEGIWLDSNSMIILNDGYYHNAFINSNNACIYNLNN